MTKMVRNDLATKWPGFEMTGYRAKLRNLNGKEENRTWDIKYHEIKGTILQIGIRYKRKMRKGSVT